MRLIYFCVFAIMTLALSGCTEMHIEGDAKVFRSSALGATIRVIVGIALVGFGGLAIAAGILPDKKAPKTKGRRRRPKASDKLSSKQRTGLLLFGGAMEFAGLFLAGITFIFPEQLHVTVYPRRVEMASTYSQTGGKELVVPFAGLASVEIREERNVIGKLKKYLVFTRKNGSIIKQIAGGNEIKAVDTIQQALADFQTNPPAGIDDSAPVAPAATVQDSAADRARDLKPDLNFDRGQQTPPTVAAAKSNDTTPAPPVKKYSLKRYPINISVPEGYAVVDETSDVQIGMKLGACYARRWETVTVVAVNSDGTITCNWDKWKSFTYRMMREDLTIAD